MDGPPSSEGSAPDLGGVAISASADGTDGAADSGAGTRGPADDIALDLAEAGPQPSGMPGATSDVRCVQRDAAELRARLCKTEPAPGLAGESEEKGGTGIPRS